MRIENRGGSTAPKKVKGHEVVASSFEKISNAASPSPQSDEFSKALVKANRSDKPANAEDPTVAPPSLEPSSLTSTSPTLFQAPPKLAAGSACVHKGGAQSGSASLDSEAQDNIAGRSELPENLPDMVKKCDVLLQTSGVENLPTGIATKLDKRSHAVAEDSFAQASAPARWMQEDASTKNAVLLEVLALGVSTVQSGAESIAVKPDAYLFQSTVTSSDASAVLGAGLPSDVPELVASPSASEKASYWVVQGTQNMAMTLEGQGDEAVSIKISLSGLDTRVDIRTAHLALRQMVEGSFQAMKEKLSDEGLSLSAVSVGNALHGQGMGQGQRDGAEARTHFLSQRLTSKVEPTVKPTPSSLPVSKNIGALSIFV